MRILFVSSRFPYPELKGDQVIISNRLRYLSRNHDITLLTFFQHERELQYLEQLKPFCAHIEAVKIGKYESIYNLFFLSAFSRLPLQTLYFRSRKFSRKLEQLLDSVEFDVIHTYLLRMAEYTQHIDKPSVLDLIDCMQLNLEKRLAFLKYPQKSLYGEELKRIKPYEKDMLEKYDASVVVSDADRQYLKSHSVVSIPLGIDTERYSRLAPLPDNRTIIFSGNMSYYPNESAILWFLNHCFEPIRRRVPDVKLKVVGIDPGNAIKKYHDGQTICVTGFVKSIIDEMSTAQIAIAPMQSGYGMHIKILEAMSCGLPVVTTSAGKGTIAAEHGVHIGVANGASAFAEACITLLNDQRGAAAMGRNARDLIVKTYSWEASVAKLEEVYQAVIDKRKERDNERSVQNFK